jgi:Holliday junction DNA helicase RuvA
MNFGSGRNTRTGVGSGSAAEPTVLKQSASKQKAAASLSFRRALLAVVDSMITFLEGMLSESLPTQVVINVRGVGYQVLIPLSSFDRLPAPGSPVRILTHLVVREDAHVLYGFSTAEERDLFRLLLHHVSGVGPKLALAILSGMSVEAFKAAVVANDLAAISRISGVGKKTAERVALELKDKVGVAAEWEASSAKNAPNETDRAVHDAVLALISLGYKQVEAHKAIKQCLARFPTGAPPEDLVRQALKVLS